MAVANSGQRLHTEEKTVQEPMRGPSRDAVLLQTVKGGEEKIQPDVNCTHESSKLRPAQTEQPAINVAPFPGVGIDFDKLDLTRSNRNFIAPPSSLAKSIVHGRNHSPMWPFKKMQLAGPVEFPAMIGALRDKLRSKGFGTESDRLHSLLHEMVWTTSNELYGELRLALNEIRKQRRDLPSDIAAEIRRLIKSIDRICRWR